VSSRVDWYLLALLAVSIFAVLFALLAWLRVFLGTREDRNLALEEEERFQAQRAYVRGLGPKLDSILRQMHSKEQSGALVPATRSKELQVLGADIRMRPDKGAVVELGLPESTVEVTEQELDALIRNAPFLDDLLKDPQAFRLLVKNPAMLRQLQEYLRLATSPR
jgi:hypothetical protein